MVITRLVKQLLRRKMRRKFKVAPDNVEHPSVVSLFRKRNCDQVLGASRLRLGQWHKIGVFTRIMLGAPLTVLRIENQLPTVVGFLLGPQAVGALWHRDVAKFQVGSRFESGGRIGAEPPKTSRWQLAEHVVDVPPVQRGASVINRYRLAVGFNLRHAARIVLGHCGPRKRNA